MAKILGISTTAIDNNIKWLKNNDIIERIGNDRNGYWQVNGVTKAAGSYSYPYGTSLKVECFANDGYVKPTELTMS